jgi:hypothetical protein
MCCVLQKLNTKTEIAIFCPLQHAMHNSRVVNCKANALQKPKQDGGHLQVVEVQSCKVFGLATFEHFGSGCTGTG